MGDPLFLMDPSLRRRDRPLHRVRPRQLDRKHFRRQCIEDCGNSALDFNVGSLEHSDMSVDGTTHSKTDAVGSYSKSLARKYYRLRRALQSLKTRVSNLERQLEGGGFHSCGHTVECSGKLQTSSPTRNLRGCDISPSLFTPFFQEPAPIKGAGSDHVPTILAPRARSLSLLSDGHCETEIVEESPTSFGVVTDFLTSHWKLTVVLLSVEYLTISAFCAYKRRSAPAKPVSSATFVASQARSSFAHGILISLAVLSSRYWPSS